ncbi:MAG: glycosyltransferase [Nitrosotalea sp.]
MVFLSVIIAAYNEEKRLPITIEKLKEELEKRKIDYELIVASDGSTDNTVEVAKKLGANSVRYKQNKGFTTALRYGFNFASGEVILNLAADVDNFDFLDSLKHVKEVDVISISKRHPESVITGYTFKRWLISNTYHNIEKFLFGKLIATSDTHFVTIYKRKVLEKVYPYCKSAHWGGETEAVVFAKYFGFTFMDVPIHITHKTLPTNIVKEAGVYWKTLLELLNIKWRLIKMNKIDVKNGA